MQLIALAVVLVTIGCGDNLGPQQPSVLIDDPIGQGYEPVPVVAPADYASTAHVPRPLLVFLPGYGGDGGAIIGRFQMTGVQDWDAGAIVIAPTGLRDANSKPHWNASAACCASARPGNDDVAYLGALVESVIAAGWNVDRDRIYALGMSNGAAMATRLACERADLFTGVVAIAGVGLTVAETCVPSRPVHIVHSHSTRDSTFLYVGGRVTLTPEPMPMDYPPVEGPGGLLDRSIVQNGCTGPAVLVQPDAYDFDSRSPGAVNDTDLWQATGCPPDGAVDFWRSTRYVHSIHTTPEFGAVVWDWIATHPRVRPKSLDF